MLPKTRRFRAGLERIGVACLMVLLGWRGGFAQGVEPQAGPVPMIQGKPIKVGLWQGKQVEYVDRNIGMVLHPGVSVQDLMPLINQFQARITSDLVEPLRVLFVEVPPTVDLFQAIATLNASSLIESASPDFVGQAFVEPRDRDFLSKQWALKNTGQAPGGVVGADIKAPAAWDITTGSPTVTIAVLDGGIPLDTLGTTLTHPDLGKNNPDKIILGVDFVDPGGYRGVRDERGHGAPMSLGLPVL